MDLMCLEEKNQMESYDEEDEDNSSGANSIMFEEKAMVRRAAP